MGMYNLDESIKGFARSSFNFGRNGRWPVIFRPRNTILKALTALQRPVPGGVRQRKFAAEFKKRNLTYELTA